MIEHRVKLLLVVFDQYWRRDEETLAIRWAKTIGDVEVDDRGRLRLR